MLPTRILSLGNFKYFLNSITVVHYHNRWLPAEIKLTEDDNHYVKNKLNDLVKWYEELTGMDEVRDMQNKVIEAQEKFSASQDKRREISKELTAVQAKLKEIYSILDTTNRGEERYLQLITQEHQILKEERSLMNEFAILEREERDNFNILSSRVQESHEKERAQAARTKYWSIIGSIIGTVIGVAGSSINNEFKMKELRKLVIESTVKSTSTAADTYNILSRHEEELSSILLGLKGIVVDSQDKEGVDGKSLMEKLGRLVNVLDSNNGKGIAHYVDRIEGRVTELKDLLNSPQRSDPHFIAVSQNFEKHIEKQICETRNILIGVAVLSIIMPICLSLLKS